MGMAATSQPLATQAALEILREGGSCVDAAIAANACLGLMEPTGCGIGGDLFAMVWIAEEERLYGLNASGRSPRGLSRDELDRQLQRAKSDRIPNYGPLGVSVPGAVDGWVQLHRRWGRLPLELVLGPAIRYAEHGFPVSELIAYYWGRSVIGLKEYPGFLDTFTKGSDRRAPAKGEIWQNPDLAQVYRRIGAEGRSGFYSGQVAETIDRFMREIGGYLRREDLELHESEWVDPVSTEYRGHRVYALPPNGQGIATLQILNLLETYDLGGWGFGSVDHVHHFVEAKKVAFADRARYYADPAMAEIPVEQLISKSYAARRRNHIDPERAARAVEPGDPALRHGDTVYLSVGDKEGNLISLIQSNFYGMGSGVCPPGLGFGFQNRGISFSLDPRHPNTYAPGKRPFHTIIPGFAEKPGDWRMAYGVMGGPTQPQAQAQIIMNLVDFGMNLQEAGDAPRMVHEGSTQPFGSEEMKDGGEVLLEEGFSHEVRRELLKRGHRLQAGLSDFGGYQAVKCQLDPGILVGASESRKDGMAAGF